MILLKALVGLIFSKEFLLANLPLLVMQWVIVWTYA